MSEKHSSPYFQLADAECSSSKVLLFPCSGGSNVGQMANTAAVAERLKNDAAPI